MRHPLLNVSLLFTIGLLDSTAIAQAISPNTQTEIRAKLAVALDRDYSNRPADELLTLAIQHSDIAVPELKRRLRAASQKHREKLDSKNSVYGDALAYVANELAVDALCDLCGENIDLFCPYLERSLDYAEGRRNSFSLAYHAIERPETPVQESVAHWTNSVISFPHFQQRLAEAMLDKYQRVPNEDEWASDPIASRIKDQVSPKLRQKIMSLATEAQSKRQRQ
jgi:hypothetical protein